MYTLIQSNTFFDDCLSPVLCLPLQSVNTNRDEQLARGQRDYVTRRRSEPAEIKKLKKYAVTGDTLNHISTSRHQDKLALKRMYF